MTNLIKQQFLVAQAHKIFTGDLRLFLIPSPEGRQVGLFSILLFSDLGTRRIPAHRIHIFEPICTNHIIDLIKSVS